MRPVVNGFPAADAKCILKAQQTFAAPELREELRFIQTHFAFLPEYITRLEKQDLPLQDALQLWDGAKAQLNSVPGEMGERIRAKFERVEERNPGLAPLKEVCGVIKSGNRPPATGKLLLSNSPLLHMSVEDAKMLKFAPTVNVDCERSFSIYKNLLSDRRHRFTKENLHKYMVCQYFFKYN